ncbi:hypothetical protein RN001_012422 [Aquatica leii]|uniref:SWIM-type domain-containing protein n=1 Tax=Aquatica leii TaxID=1421715 RepID=A0AAN7SPH2_9COLE|nr:hypothetical protein RN001_012422 [Aquatica leii]
MDTIRFSVMDYFNYLKGDQNSRCVYEGEEVLSAGHIIFCGCRGKKKDLLEIVSLCLQTTALKNFPHTIQGNFLINKNQATVGTMVCSCKAGNGGRCKHISATLLFCTRITLEKLEPVSQTDLKCVWSMRKAETKNMYEAVSIDEMPCFKNKVSPSVNIQ